MTVNIALLGTGRIGSQSLAPALARVPEARLWSVLSRDDDRAQAFAQRFQARAPQPAFTDLAALLADPELNAVIVATPDRLHAAQTLAAAAAGKHVLVEKPMATSVAEARAMVDACEQAGVRLGVAYHLHWNAGHRKLVERIRAGLLGELRHMRAQWTFQAPDASNWRARPQFGRWWSLAGVGTHCLDLIRWVMVPQCGEVVEINSTISRAVWGGPHDETALLALRFQSGATAELCSSVLFQSPSRVEIYGNRGYFICDGTLGTHGTGKIVSHQGVLEFPVRDPYAAEIADFVTAIRDRREPEVNGREGLRNVELLAAALPEPA